MVIGLLALQQGGAWFSGFDPPRQCGANFALRFPSRFALYSFDAVTGVNDKPVKQFHRFAAEAPERALK